MKTQPIAIMMKSIAVTPRHRGGRTASARSRDASGRKIGVSP